MGSSVTVGWGTPPAGRPQSWRIFGHPAVVAEMHVTDVSWCSCHHKARDPVCIPMGAAGGVTGRHWVLLLFIGRPAAGSWVHPQWLLWAISLGLPHFTMLEDNSQAPAAQPGSNSRAVSVLTGPGLPIATSSPRMAVSSACELLRVENCLPHKTPRNPLLLHQTPRETPHMQCGFWLASVPCIFSAVF